MTPHELASEIPMAWARVCAALNDLAIHGQVELDGRQYRRTDRAELRA